MSSAVPRTGLAAACELLAPHLERPLVVVDGGARWGVPPEWDHFGVQAHVVAFEPDPAEAAELRRRYAADGRITVVEGALADRDGTATLHITADASGSSLYEPAPMTRYAGISPVVRTVPVPLTTLDAWTAEGHPPVDAVKLDVQGAELDILRGAARSLASVRAIRAEVHLNRMYTGAALFGEVDAFLRDHGFELWSLPVTARYSQQTDVGRRDRIEVVEVDWFDDVPVAAGGHGGQLVWADAVYVRDDFCLPPAAAPAGDPLRDACIALGMELPQLAEAGLARAGREATGARAEAIAAALAALAASGPEGSYRRSREADLARRSRPLTEPVVVDLGARIQGWGWHDPQPFGEGWLRWTGPQAEAAVDLPVVAPAGSTVEVRLAGGADPEALATVAVDVDGVPVPVALRAEDGLVVARAVTTAPVRRGFTRIVLRTRPPTPWCVIDPSSDDWTEHGVAVVGLTLAPPSA